MDRSSRNLSIRPAEPTDALIILNFIKELAIYEQLASEVSADLPTLTYWLFDKKTAEAVILEEADKVIGFALFFYNFSTFLGKAGIYLEDLYLEPQHRGKGYGSLVLTYLAKLALKQGCGRLEFSCLDWNEPALACYRKAKAISLYGWMTYRICGETLKELAER